MHQSDILALCSLIAGLSSAFAIGTPAVAALDQITAGHGTFILAILAVSGIIANQVLRIYGSPSSPQGKQ